MKFIQLSDLHLVPNCPSIEDKVVKFPGRDAHHIFLEPQTTDSNEVYPDGLSTSLPYDVQLKYLRAVKGLEAVEIVRPGYAVEYDFVPPTQLFETFETKPVRGLFHAGQINGTSGYEEAAAQGIYAGINAACFVQKRKPLILKRSEAYIGVLVDDLVTKGTKEPYRMFTSRAEHRLILREDNADIRLAGKAYELGLIAKEYYNEIIDREKKIEDTLKSIKKTYIMPSQKIDNITKKIGAALIKDSVPLGKFLRRPQVDTEIFGSLYDLSAYSNKVRSQILYRIKYEPFVVKEEREIEKFAKSESISIPLDFPYQQCSSLSNEVCEKLINIKPMTIGQASRIPGVTPAAVSILLIYLNKYCLSC